MTEREPLRNTRKMATDEGLDTRPLPRTKPRELWQIAREIKADWKHVYFGAVPYLDAMGALRTMADRYGADPAEDVVMYFLSNTRTWRGPVAKRIKAELNAMLAAEKARR